MTKYQPLTWKEEAMQRMERRQTTADGWRFVTVHLDGATDLSFWLAPNEDAAEVAESLDITNDITGYSYRDIAPDGTPIDERQAVRSVASEVAALRAAFAKWPADGIVRVGVYVDEKVAA